MRQPLRLMALLLALAALLRPGNLWAQCVTTSTVPYTTAPATDPTAKRAATETVTGISFTYGGYGVNSAPNNNGTTSTLDVFDHSATYTAQIANPALIWRQQRTGALPTGTTSNLEVDPNSPYYTYVTLTFTREVSNLSFVVQDIDKGLQGVTPDGGSTYTDEFILQAKNAAGTLVTLPTGGVTWGTNKTSDYVSYATGAININGNTDAWQGARGTSLNGTANTPNANGTTTFTFPSPVKTVTLSFRNLNTRTYTAANNSTTTPARLQTIGIQSVSWCGQADVTTSIAAPASLTAGVQSGNYTATYANNGPGVAGTTTRTVSVPANTASAVATTVTGATVAGSQAGGWTITFPAGASVASGNSVPYTFTVTPLAVANITVTSNTSTTEDEGTNPTPATNTASVTTSVTPAADLTTTLTGPGSLTAGLQSGNYTVTYTNNGPSVATSTTRTVSIPSAYLSAAPSAPGSSSVTLTGGNYIIAYPNGANVAAGSGGTVSYTFTITPTVLTSNGQTITATSTTAPGTGGTGQGNNTAADTAPVSYVVGSVADVGVSFSGGQADNSTVVAGTTVTYAVTFSNNGPSTATGTKRSVSIPAGVPSVTVAAGNGTLSGNATTGWTITYNTNANGDDVPLNATGTTYSFSFVAPATGPVTITGNTSTTSGEGTNTNPNSATRTLNVTPITLSGTVYDDVNYGGGAGRTYATANTANSGFTLGRPGAVVEIYNNAGAYVGSTTTGTNGAYSYNLPAAGNYTVRVVNSTVTSARTPNATGVLPVQTYVFGNANQVGGANPAYTDAAANTSSQTLAALSTGTVTPQSLYTATFNTTTTNSGVDFGFNFDTVVNTNDVATVSGNNAQGSLRQFILNANALGGEAALAQVGFYTNAQNLATGSTATGRAGVALPGGTESSIFMIPAGQLGTAATNKGVAVITAAAALPQLTGTLTAINGATQTYNIGNTNDVLLGTGGTVGTAATALSQLNGPEVQLIGSTAIAFGFDLATSATSNTIQGLAVLDFGNARDNDGAANIRSAANNLLLTQNVLGTTAVSFAAPPTLTNADNVRLTTGTAGIIVSNNLIGYSNSKGISINNGVTNVIVSGNEIRSNGLAAANFDGVDIQGRNASITNNLLTGTSGQGVDSYRSAGGNSITGNTVTDNGRGTTGLNPNETPGIRIYGAGNTVSQNIISDNYGAGIMLEGTQGNAAAVSTTLLSQNSIFNNGNVRSRNNLDPTGDVGIDLQANGDTEVAGTSPYVTLNSATTTGANGLLNYPIITSATISGNNLTVSGYAKSGAVIELFTAQANPAAVNATGANFGQGRTYLGTVTEGSSADTDTRTGLSYSGNIHGFNQGSDTNANAFTFTIALASALPAGTLITSTATLGGATSEFSGNASTVALTGYVYEDVNYGGGLGRPRTATGAVTRPGAKVELYDATGNYVTTAITDANGQYAFATTPGNYTVRVVNNSVLSSRTGATAASGTATTGYVSNQVPVQTYNGTTSRVGGENPAFTDAAANTGTQTLASLSSGTVTPESISAVTVGSTATTGPDFGFNFDLVVNTNDVATVTGNNAQGSLRQFILNSNALGGETTLAPVYTATGGTTTALATGLETSIFMIPNGSAVAGQRAGLTNAAGTANFTTPNNGSGTAATITLAAALPDVAGTTTGAANATAIDGSTQTRSTGDSNAPVATLGSESTGPEVLINLNGKAALTFRANDDQLVSMGVYNSVNSGQGISIASGSQRLILQGNTINNNGANVSFDGTAAATPSAATITGNIIRDSQRGNADGIELNGNNSNMTITGNQILRNSAFGIDFIGGANSNNTITGNTFAYNGTGTGGGQLSGIGLRSSGSNGNNISQNTFRNNSGAGIVALSGTTGNIFSQNSFLGNGVNPYGQSGAYTAPTGLGLAIDLMAGGSTGTNGDGVTVNDNGDTDTGANGLINFPIIQSATINNANGTVTVTGFARPGVTVELYLAADDPTHFGEGQTFITSLVQGTAAGTVGGVTTGIAGTYGPGTLNDGLTQGTDNTLAYSFTFTPTAAQLAALQQSTALLTSTATLTAANSGNFGTSEFSGNARVFQAPVPNDASNASIASNTTVPVTLSPSLSGTPYGLTANVTTSTTNTIAYYTVSLPSSGTLYYNGTALTAANAPTTQVSDLSQLKFVPQYGSTNTVTFTYTATDANGLTSNQHSTSGTITSGPATYTIPVTTAADVTASITGSTTLTSGQPTGYYVATYTNVGPATAAGVAQTVTLPVGATLTTAQRSAITTAYPNASFGTASGSGATTITFTPAAGVTLNGGDASSYRFVFTAPTAAGSSTISASVSTTTNEGANAAPNLATLALTTNAPTDVQPLLTASATTAAPGATASFTATFRNNTAQPAAGVVATVQLPVGLTPTSVSGQTGTTASTTVTYGTVASLNTTTGLLTYTLNSLAANAQPQSVIAFTMPTTSPVAATASVSTTTAETNSANNVASASIAPAPSFNLATTLTGPASATAGSPVTLYVSTSNLGPQAISGAVQTVTIPAGLNAAGSPNVFISNGGTYNNATGVVTFPALGSLPTGQMVGNTITFNAPTSSFPLRADVTPTDTGGDTDASNNVAYLNGASSNTNVTVNAASGAATNVYATLTANAQIVAGGTQVTYTAGLGNSGPASATNVSAQLQLIPNLGLATLLVNNQTGTVSTDGKTIGYPNGSTYTIATGVLAYANTMTLPVTTTPFTATATVTVPAGVGNDGQLLAVMSVGSQSPDNVPSDNVKSVVVTVQPQAELATTLTGPTSGVTVGQTVSYSALFTNNGPSTARAVTQTVQLPAGLTAAGLLLNGATGTGTTTITFGSGTTASTYNAATGLLTLPALATDAAGTTQLFTVSFPAPAQPFVVSSAIGSGTADGVLANNAASVATAVTPTADVAVTVAGPATAVAGNQITYAVTTTNNGPVAATGVAPTLLLPANLTGVVVSGGTYDAPSGLVTFTPTTSLAPGASAVSYVTLPMPTAPTGGSISPLASVTTTSYDNAAANNAAGITTSVAPNPGTSADLIATITGPAGNTATAGGGVSLTFSFQNSSASTSAAAYVRPVANLPTGLTAGSLNVAGGGGTLSNGQVTFSNGSTYDPATGTLTFPPVASLAIGSTASYSVSFPAPGSASLVVTSEVTANTTDPVAGNNVASSPVTVNASFDLTTAIVGPAAALTGQQNVYTVTTTSSGFSPAGPVTQTATLPQNQTVGTLLVNGRTGTLSGTTINYPDNSTYNQNTGLLTFPSIGSLAPGAASAVTNNFTLTMPNVASLNIPANVSTTASGETKADNNSNSVTTTKAPLSFAPVAENIVNTLQSARGSTSTASLLISPLYATDPDGSIAITNGYSILTLPSSGTLSYNGTAISSIPTGGYLLTNPALLSYQPAGGFVGNAFFTYAAIDNSGIASNPALYTIPVAQDLNTTYSTYNTGKGNANPYVNNDVLAQLVDPNTAQYTSNTAQPATPGIIYNASTGVQQAGTSNGLATTGTNVTLVSGTLPSGVDYDRATGRIYVSNAAALTRSATPTNYALVFQTTDLNGGINQVPVTITIGAYPLPVELVAFTAQAVQNRDGLLKWTTASELHNDHFDIERSLDGTSFTKLGAVAGQGSKASATDYAFTDQGIGPKVVAGQPVYYRLKQVDADGTSTYSPVRTVSFTGATVATVTLYPNPATTATGLDLSALPATSTYQVLLLDAVGRQVRSVTMNGGQLQPLDLHDVSAGTYNVLVTGQQANGAALRQMLRLIKE